VDEARLADALRRHAARHAVPGAAVGILRGGATLCACHGRADVRTGEPVRAATRFAIGSLAKTLVAAVIAALAETGRLSLDDPAAAHVPELAGCAWARRATLRDLLANRSGIPLREELEFGFEARAGADDAALARLVAEVAVLEPGPRVWSYSNVGWCVLGRALENVTGLPFADAMRGRLAAAGLVETSFAPGSAYGPAGIGVRATVADVLRLAAWQLDDPALAPLAEVHADVAIHGWLDGWCLGQAVFHWTGVRAVGWDGVVGGSRAVLRILPEHGAAVAVLANAEAGRALARSLVAELVDELCGIRVPPLRLDPAPGAAGDLARFAGTFAWPDRRVEVAASGPALLLRADRAETEARPLDARTFVVDAGSPDRPTVTFGAFDAAGRPAVLYEMLWGLPRVTS
jgi:CubicO group peptidase (beta-lactamase class C family)